VLRYAKKIDFRRFQMKSAKIMTVWFTILLLTSFLFGGGIRDGSGADVVKEVALKGPTAEIGSFKVEKIIKDTMFAVPIGGTIDNKGNIYIVDMRLVKLFKFSREGKLLNSLERKGSGPGDLSTPVIVKYRDNKLYVFSFQLPYVNVFDRDLKFIEQLKFANLRSPLSVEFIGDDILASSSFMRMFMGHQFFLYSANGEMKAKLVPDEKSDPAQNLKGKTMNMKMPSLLYCDPISGDLWSAAVAPYEIILFNKNFEKIKILRGDKTFRFVEREAGGGRMAFKKPVDKASFFTRKNGKLFYGYRYDKETYLDVIENDCITKRFKSKEIRKILFMIGRNNFLASFYEGEDDGEPAVGIVSIK
jgi:hypothetical protein